MKKFTIKSMGIFKECFILFILFHSYEVFTQSIKVEPFTINYTTNTSFDAPICAPYTEYSIEGMNTPDGMGFTYDYYDESLKQFKILLASLLKVSTPFQCENESGDKAKYKLECRLESQSEGKVVTAFSKISLEISMTWKLTRLEDGEVLFREKSVGMHKNKIGNAFSGKSKARERAAKALEMAFVESRKMLETKLIDFK